MAFRGPVGVALVVALIFGCNHGVHAIGDGPPVADTPTDTPIAADGAGDAMADAMADAMIDAPPDAPPPDVMYAPTPTTLWEYHFGAAVVDEFTGVAFDPDGNVYVAGHAPTANDFGTGTAIAGAIVASYSPTGTLRWVHNYGPGPFEDWACGSSACTAARSSRSARSPATSTSAARRALRRRRDADVHARAGCGDRRLRERLRVTGRRARCGRRHRR